MLTVARCILFVLLYCHTLPVAGRPRTARDGARRAAQWHLPRSPPLVRPRLRAARPSPTDTPTSDVPRAACLACTPPRARRSPRRPAAHRARPRHARASRARGDTAAPPERRRSRTCNVFFFASWQGVRRRAHAQRYTIGHCQAPGDGALRVMPPAVVCCVPSVELRRCMLSGCHWRWRASPRLCSGCVSIGLPPPRRRRRARRVFIVSVGAAPHVAGWRGVVGTTAQLASGQVTQGIDRDTVGARR